MFERIAKLERLRVQARYQVVQRLLELDSEWDIARARQAHFSFVDGKGDPEPLLRRMGFRSRQEIEEEKAALRLFLDDRVDERERERAA
jgi:hypothetical protein